MEIVCTGTIGTHCVGGWWTKGSAFIVSAQLTTVS